MVDNVGGVQGAGGNLQARKLKSAYKFQEAGETKDAVEISDVMKLKGVEGVRFEKVMEIRKAIANGNYFTPEKLDEALDSAIDQVALEEKSE